jgi:hypothetical protein
VDFLCTTYGLYGVVVLVREISLGIKKHFYLPRKSVKFNGYYQIDLGGGRGGTEH